MDRYRYIYLETVGSTSDYLKENHELLNNNFTVVHTDNQTSGRGRSGRVWHASDLSLTFSFVLHPGAKNTLGVTIYSGLAVARGLNRLGGSRVEIKWPNDLFFQGKKLGGILTEQLFIDGKAVVVVGIGLNLGLDGVPAEIEQRGVSLFHLTGKKYDSKEILDLLMGEMVSIFDDYRYPLPPEIVEEWNSLSEKQLKEITLFSTQETLRYVSYRLNRQGTIDVVLPDGSARRVDEGEIGY